VSGALDSPQLRSGAVRSWTRHLGVEADEELREHLAEGSIASAAHATALAGPARPAVEVDGAALTHGELDDRAARMAGWFARRGVADGDLILLSSPTSLAFVVAYLAALRAGITVVLANPAYTEAELDHLVADSGAVYALAVGAGLERLRSVAARRRRLREAVDLSAVTADDLSSEPEAAPMPPPVAAAGDRIAVLAYTSGTTGKPKAVPLTDANLLSSIRAAMLAWRWNDDDVLVHALPLFHQHGLGGLHATLLSGSRAIICSRFEPGSLCTALSRARATVLFAVPSIYSRLVDWEGIDAADLRSLRLVVSGSAAMSPQLAEKIASLAGQLPLERYGTTESGLDVSNPYDGPRLVGSVGLPLPGIELAIAGPGGEPLAPGGDGEIVVRGPQVFGGYRGDPSATAEAFYPGGWFRTGDVGRIDPDSGYLRITGRLKELIITGGMNVYPREVEFALEEHAGVERASVVGVPSERWGEEVVAAIVPAKRSEQAPDPDELIAFARSRLAPFKCPKRIVIVRELPVNALGKVVTARVPELFK
jgi:malonyl-CoA/methylmalonyl-CoA synthetase